MTLFSPTGSIEELALLKINSLGTVHLPSTHTLQAVDDGLLQLLVGDLECESDAKGPCVYQLQP